MELAAQLVRMRSRNDPGSGTEPHDHCPHNCVAPYNGLRHDDFSRDKAANSFRRTITAEAMTLVAQTIASAKMRHEPIPFPASLEAQQRAAAVSESSQSVDITSMPNPSVNTKVGEPSAKRANPEVPASASTNAPHPKTNWAELLAQHRPADRIVVPVTLITALASASRRTQRPPTSGAPLAAAVPKNGRAASPESSKSWEQVQAHVGELPLPAGIHDGYVLGRLVQSRRPISGLVVSIGISMRREQTPRTACHESIPTAVRNLVQSLLGPRDFACASATDEYLLIFPEVQGAAAQRRLGEIAQKLWDFQLRMLGQAAILFSWGGVEVRGESLDEAIQSASERMEETRRTRSAKSLEKHGLRIAG